MKDSPSTSHECFRRQLEEDVNTFLESGGEIEQVPIGKSNEEVYIKRYNSFRHIREGRFSDDSEEEEGEEDSFL